MNLRSSALRRCAAAALACAAISVPAVALASPAVPRSVVSLPRCPAANTYVWFALSPNGTAGSVVYPVEFTNVGRRTCTLRGIPSIWAVSKSGRRIGPAARKITVTARTVTVRPNQTVHALLSIGRAGRDRGLPCRHRLWAGGAPAGPEAEPVRGRLHVHDLQEQGGPEHRAGRQGDRRAVTPEPVVPASGCRRDRAAGRPGRMRCF